MNDSEHTHVSIEKHICPSHKLECRALYEVVLADIRHHAQIVCQDPEKFYNELLEKVEGKASEVSIQMIKSLEELKQRNKELDKMFFSCYEDRSKGILSEKRFSLVAESIEKEQAEVLAKIADVEAQIEERSEKAKDVEYFADEIRKCAGITKLTDELLHKLIKRIEVGQTQEINGEKVQHLKIIYDFVGEIGSGYEAEFINGNYCKSKVSLLPAE